MAWSLNDKLGQKIHNYFSSAIILYTMDRRNQ